MTGPAELAPARKVFWRLVRERAGSPQAIRDAFVEAGHDLTDGAVGRWIRGETDPGWEVTLWASRRWDVSLDELVKGEALERTFADQLDDLARELAKLKSTQDWLLGWALRDPEAAAAYADEIRAREARSRDERGA